MFPDRDSAEAAYASAACRGYSQDDMHLVVSDETRQRQFLHGKKTELGPKAAEGAGIGGAIGGTVGAPAAARGGLIGALVGWGMPEERVKQDEEGIKSGSILMGLNTHTPEDAAHIEDSRKTNRGTQVYR